MARKMSMRLEWILLIFGAKINASNKLKFPTQNVVDFNFQAL